MIDLAGSLEDQRTHQRRETSHGPMAKTLADLVRYCDVIRETRPTVVVEMGTWTGASAHWFGYQMERANTTQGTLVVPLVVTVDRQAVDLDQEPHYAVVQVVGDSVSADVVAEVRANLWHRDVPARTMLVLDSDHSAGHVRAELDAYADLVSPGCYLVVEDTLTRYMPNSGGYDGSPADALDAWLPFHPEFMVDTEVEDLLPRTQHPGGWLLRVPPYRPTRPGGL